jgi:hypothetical protein
LEAAFTAVIIVTFVLASDRPNISLELRLGFWRRFRGAVFFVQSFELG